jgi:hypothetical protein
MSYPVPHAVFSNEGAYSARAISYASKMYMKLALGCNVVKLITVVTYLCSNFANVCP